MVNYLNTISTILLFYSIQSCLSPEQIQGQCSACSNGIQILVKGFCYPRIIGCLQYSEGPICVECQNGYQLNIGECIRSQVFRENSPAPLAALQESILRYDDLFDKLQTEQILNQKERLIQDEQKVTLNFPSQSFSLNSIPTVLQQDNVKPEQKQENAENEYNEDQQQIMSRLFEKYRFLQENFLSVTKRNNGFYVLSYSDSKTISFYSKGNNFIFNRPIVSQSSFLCTENEQQFRKIPAYEDIQIWNFIVTQYPEIGPKQIIQAYAKVGEDNINKNFRYVFEQDNHFIQIDVYRFTDNKKQITSIKRFKKAQVLYSNNFNYNLDSDFFDKYTKALKIVNEQHSYGIKFVIKRFYDSRQHYRIINDNSDVFSYTIINNTPENVTFSPRTPYKIDYLTPILEQYPELSRESISNHNIGITVIRYFFGKHKSISGFVNGKQFIFNTLYQKYSDKTYFQIRRSLFGDAQVYIIRQLKYLMRENISLSVSKVEYAYQNDYIYVKFILLQSEFQYQVIAFRPAYELDYKMLKVSQKNLANQQFRQLYQSDYNYNEDRQFFANYQTAFSMSGIQFGQRIDYVVINLFDEGVKKYRVMYISGISLQYEVKGKQVHLIEANN